MGTTQEARGIVADAEKALRDLMQREIRDQRYADLAELARLADGIGRLLRGDPDQQERDSPPSAGRAARTRRIARKTTKTSPKKQGYPQFRREDNKLVKIGWSKKIRDEYEHRAPRETVAAFVEYLSSQVGAGKTFVIDELMPVPDSAGGDIPSYQVYLTLAWLRDVGAVEKKGRSGYVFRNGVNFVAIWDGVPVR